MLSKLKFELKKAGNKEQAKNLQRFFKTAPGEYGEGDIFLGIKLPIQRQIAKKYYNLNLNDLQNLLDSKIHEHRLVALIILLHKYKKSDNKKEIFDFYLSNTRNINNWDLVDLSAHKIVGDFLLDKSREILYNLAESKNLWERRISIISTFAFLPEKQFEDSVQISKILLEDKHDLIHKAVGWVLREVGKKDEKLLENFIKKNYDRMARTTLRYSIEKFSEEKRKKFLKGEF